ncbi:hypothetical protein ACHQM5_023532 [Ranunculus cassubicifolius]
MPISISSNPKSHLYFHSSPPHIIPNSLKPPIFSLKFPTQSLNPKLKLQIQVYNSSTNSIPRELLDDNKFNWDVLLSIAELICIIPSAILSIGCIVNLKILHSQKSVLLNRVLVWQICLLVGGVVIGGVIRRRQWGRLSGVRLSGASKLDLVGRIDKLEEDLRSSTTIIRMLSRQLEKLGIRFRVTRKSLKEPISEAAALSLKNSEATQALGMQKDILEKELGEIQKVLLAMQDQQQKQLELILAVAKAGKLTDNRREPAVETTTKQLNSVPINKQEKQIGNQIKSGGRQKIPNNDSA